MKKNKSSARSILDSKPLWMLLSLLISLSIWTYVVSTETATVTQVFRGIPVEITGDDLLLSSRNLIVTDVETNSVRVEIRGPRRIVDALNSEDLTAQVDVSKLTRAAYAAMKYKIIYPEGTETRYLTVTSYSPETVNFMVSNQNTISVPVRGGFEGQLASGYMAESPVFNPATVTITGPDAYLKDISYAWVSFGSGKTVESSYTEEVPFTLMNADGDPVPTEYLTGSEETVEASLPIMEVKEVPLAVSVLDGAGATAENTKITITPDRIKLTGDSAILAGLNQIVLTTIDLTDFRSTFSETYPIQYDNTLRNISGATEARVDVEIVGLETASYNVKNISVINGPENANVEIETESLEVVIRGAAEKLESLTAESIRAVADLTDYKDSSGPFMAPVKIYCDGVSDVGAIGKYTISVNIDRSEKKDVTTNDTGSYRDSYAAQSDGGGAG